ncbi:hypothetical protein ACVRZD_01355 [Streptococcus hongkongensis]|nr:hypothetical protein NC01_08100 [Streptococcus uberis]
MSNSILSTMTNIELEAKAISDSYSKKKKEYTLQKTEEMKQLKATYDLEIGTRLNENETALLEELRALEAKVSATEEKNQAKVQTILEDNKESIINQIVHKVVEKYGY